VTKPQTLRTATDYRPALLWLMGQLERATISDVLEEFERVFGDLIPPEHFQENESGSIKWDNYVRWARQYLVNADLMGNDGRGTWTITPAGQQWLSEYPDGGGEKLKASIRPVGKQIDLRAQSRTDLDRPVEFTVADHRFRMSGRQVLDRARQVLAEGIPPEAQRYKEWVVYVDGQPVGVKWLFSLATELDVQEFHTPGARNVLRRMGIEVRSARQASPLVSPGASTDALPSDELPRSEFLENVASTLAAHLPHSLAPSAIRSQANCLQIAYPEFRMSQHHYEVYLPRSRHEVALHFESAPEVNLAWLEHFTPEVAQLSRSLGYPVQAERWGRRWARVKISLPRKPLTATLAQEIGALMARFIQATYPIMQKVLTAVPAPSRTRGRRPAQSPEDMERRYRLLDVEVRAVRDFLDGHAAGRPGDERLCYWVYLCLTLELHREGWQLFTHVDPSQVSRSLYERTSRFAQACRIRAEVQV